eukprot:TRINITY_DN23798_c0_g1_i1.p1 TRINITY_DN23798_c0_g1~~TRINITY_DN23798_c0_g1_i1.p1  ORF type:complete len:356 (+),score=59.55 TRINITY_DN23798_c0_g1_i1:53-1120(+)
MATEGRSLDNLTNLLGRPQTAPEKGPPVVVRRRASVASLGRPESSSSSSRLAAGKQLSPCEERPRRHSLAGEGLIADAARATAAEAPASGPPLPCLLWSSYCRPGMSGAADADEIVRRKLENDGIRLPVREYAARTIECVFGRDEDDAPEAKPIKAKQPKAAEETEEDVFRKRLEKDGIRLPPREKPLTIGGMSDFRWSAETVSRACPSDHGKRSGADASAAAALEQSDAAEARKSSIVGVVRSPNAKQDGISAGLDSEGRRWYWGTERSVTTPNGDGGRMISRPRETSRPNSPHTSLTRWSRMTVGDGAPLSRNTGFGSRGELQSKCKNPSTQSPSTPTASRPKQALKRTKTIA